MTAGTHLEKVTGNGWGICRPQGEDELKIEMIYSLIHGYCNSEADDHWRESAELSTHESCFTDRPNLHELNDYENPSLESSNFGKVGFAWNSLKNEFDEFSFNTYSAESNAGQNYWETELGCHIDAAPSDTPLPTQASFPKDPDGLSAVFDYKIWALLFLSYPGDVDKSTKIPERPQHSMLCAKNMLLDERELWAKSPCEYHSSCTCRDNETCSSSLKRRNRQVEAVGHNYSDIWTLGCVLLEMKSTAEVTDLHYLGPHTKTCSFESSRRSTEPPHLKLESSISGPLRFSIRSPFVPTWIPKWDDVIYIIRIAHWNAPQELQVQGDGKSTETTNVAMGKEDASIKRTCQWIFSNEEYLQWREQKDGTLWLSGGPGTGKSILTSTVIGKLRNDHRIGEFVVTYCADADYQGASPVTAILWQILTKMLLREPRGKLRARIQSIFSELFHIGDRVSVPIMKLLMSSIRHNLRRDETMYLLLDGLDETGDDSSERDLIKEFIDHASYPDPYHRIKCFVSTRPDFLGDRQFGRTMQSAKRVDLDTQQLNRQDFILYVQDSLLLTPLPREVLESKELEQKLATDARGSFIWVKLVLNTIHYSSGSGAALKAVRDFITSSITIDLDRLYTILLDQISDSHRLAALSMLKWVVHAARPLHVKELLDALKLQTGIALDDVNVCDISSGLLTSNVNEVVRLAHSTVRGFLQSQFKTDQEGVSQEAHESIAETCMGVLSPENLLASLGLLSENPGPTSNQPPKTLFGYAQRYWLFHYTLAECRSTFLPGLLHHALSKCLELYGFPRNKAIHSTHNPETLDASSLTKTSISALEIINLLLVVGARFGLNKLVKMELEMGANVDFAFGPENLTPLMWASRAGYLEIVDLLIQYGADVHVQSSGGTTALLYAIAKTHLEIVELLLAHGAHSPLECSRGGYPTGSFTELFLSTTISRSCTVCEQVQTDYELSPDENGVSEPLSPIRLPTEFFPKRDIQSMISALLRSSTSELPGKEYKTRVRWFSGVKMHTALKMAARRGVEDIRKLLILAGNDIDLVERSLSMSKLVSKLRIA